MASAHLAVAERPKPSWILGLHLCRDKNWESRMRTTQFSGRSIQLVSQTLMMTSRNLLPTNYRHIRFNTGGKLDYETKKETIASPSQNRESSKGQVCTSSTKWYQKPKALRGPLRHILQQHLISHSKLSHDQSSPIEAVHARDV